MKTLGVDGLNSKQIAVNHYTSVFSAAISNAMLRAWLFLLRQDVKFTRLNVKRLSRRNRISGAPVVASGGPVVSMTSYGSRMQSVHLVLESIGAGALLPSRLILWIQDPDTFHSRPSAIRRLETRGLEVRLTDNYGPHTKYFPYLLSTDTLSLPLVIADDDVLYPRTWLAALWNAYCEDAAVVNCHRAHVMPIIDGVISPYARWQACKTNQPAFRHFATGVGGCIYPPEFLVILKHAGSGFLGICPKADDVWLHANALRAGLQIRQIGRRSLDFPFLPGTQNNSLSSYNAVQGGNDRQIALTYTERDIARVCAESKPGGSRDAYSFAARM